MALTTEARVARKAARLRGEIELGRVGGVRHGSEGGGVREEGGQRGWGEKTERRAREKKEKAGEGGSAERGRVDEQGEKSGWRGGFISAAASGSIAGHYASSARGGSANRRKQNAVSDGGGSGCRIGGNNSGLWTRAVILRKLGRQWWRTWKRGP